METRQEQLEAEMLDRGVSRFRDRWNADRARGDVSQAKSVKELIGSQIEPMAVAVREAMERANSGRAGRRNHVMAALLTLEPEVISYLTAKAVINGVISKHSYGFIQRSLGGAIEDEIRIQKLAIHDESAIDWVQREVKRRKITERHSQRAYYVRMEKLRKSPHRPWKSADKIRCGATLIEMFAEATRLVKVGYKRTGKKTTAVLDAIPQLFHWVDARNDILELLSPDLRPMVEPPKPWTNLDDGGYHTYRVPLVKGLKDEHRACLDHADLSSTLAAINALDATGYRVNREVLAVMQTLIDKEITPPGLEGATFWDIPEKPEDIATNDKARRDYSKQARNAHDHNASAASIRMSFERSVALAESFKDEEVLYFPNQLDFRGRVYSMPATLNPQGPDFSRALLEFNVGKAVDSTGLFWLRVNLANLYGEDKVSLHDRVVWAMSHNEEICAVSDDPLGSLLWWAGADKPWQFLAACIDYGLVLKGHKSHIRVGMDGSCNGIQHFAAMLLDPVAAAAVNLAVSEVPRDIYQDVADVVISDLKLETDPQKRFWAQKLLALGIDRKLTKRPVMVMPYGGTFHSTMNYVEAEAEARGWPDEFGDDWNDVNTYLSHLVHNGTRKVVKSGAEVMNWLQEVAKVASKANVHLAWKTPVGFTARQGYVKHKGSIIKTYLDGKLVRSTQDYEPTDRINPDKSRNSISPNYVHSMDASAMMMAILLAKRYGVTHFHCIHDDFGTHAADTQDLYECLRSAFVGIYSVDQLKKTYEEFKWQLPDEFLPEPPERGDFDIWEVNDSKYFFS